MTSIFVSYRKADGDHAAAHLDHRLTRAFGAEQVFLASRSIEPGVSYEECITLAVKKSAVMLVVIGPHWLTEMNSTGQRRIKTQDDWVRGEIRLAFENQVDVVPILLDNVRPLQKGDLPADIARLAFSQYLQLRLRRFDDDANEIVARLASKYDLLKANSPTAQPNPPVATANVTPFYLRQRALLERGQDDVFDVDIAARDHNDRIRSRLSGRVHRDDVIQLIQSLQLLI